MRKTVLFLSLGLIASSAAAQLRLPHIARRPATANPSPANAAPVLGGIDALRADFAAQSGGTTIYFGAESTQLGAPARAVLAAQANWLRRHPEIVVRVEGFGDSGDTRDHAIAVGARRAEEARTYLLMMGVPSAQVSATSWGKERPGLGRAVTVLVR